MQVSELVEDLMAYIPLPPSGSRTWLEHACVSFQPGDIQAFANVSALRASTQSLGPLSAEASRIFAAHGREDFMWFLGPHTTPPNAADLLAELGARAVSSGAAMVLDREPPTVPGVEIRPVTTAEQLLIGRLIGAATEIAGGVAGDREQHVRATNDAAWIDYTSYAGRRMNFLAYLDGEPVAMGGLLLTEHQVAVLSGAATLPSARGRGLYRALIHARWVEAQRRNAGPLVVQASPMSSPILADAGFRPIANLTLITQSTT